MLVLLGNDLFKIYCIMRLDINRDDMSVPRLFLVLMFNRFWSAISLLGEGTYDAKHNSSLEMFHHKGFLLHSAWANLLLRADVDVT